MSAMCKTTHSMCLMSCVVPDMDDKDGKTDAEQSGTNTIDRCEVPLPKRSTTNFTSSLRSSGPKQRPITSNIGGQQDLKRETNGDSKSMRLVRPRIPKTDFRRNYSIMWANVFNSCDKSIMLKHLQHFYHPDVSVTQRDVREGNLRCTSCVNTLFIPPLRTCYGQITR